MQFGSFTGVKPASRNSFRLGPYYLFVSTRGTAVCLGNLWQVKVRTQDCFAVWTFELLSDLPPVSPNWKSPQISSWSWELAVYDKYNDWLVTTAVHLFVLISHHVGIPFQSPQSCGAFLETAVTESKRREHLDAYGHRDLVRSSIVFDPGRCSREVSFWKVTGILSCW
jgi:hypothetical protein